MSSSCIKYICSHVIAPIKENAINQLKSEQINIGEVSCIWLLDEYNRIFPLLSRKSNLNCIYWFVTKQIHGPHTEMSHWLCPTKGAIVIVGQGFERKNFYKSNNFIYLQSLPNHQTKGNTIGNNIHIVDAFYIV